MPEMDQGLKRLLPTHPADLLAFAVPGAEFLGTLPPEVATEPQLTRDTLLRVRSQGQECAVDVEAEARARPDIGALPEALVAALAAAATLSQWRRRRRPRRWSTWRRGWASPSADAHPAWPLAWRPTARWVIPAPAR